MNSAQKAGQNAGSPARGQPLPADLRRKMETAFDTDLSAVRIQEDQAVEHIGAEAYTRGNQIQFAPGRFRPYDSEGRHLIGHELAHVIQQRRGQVPSPGGRFPMLWDQGLEHDADSAASRAMRGEPAGLADTAPEASADAGSGESTSDAIQPMFPRKKRPDRSRSPVQRPAGPSSSSPSPAATAASSSSSSAPISPDPFVPPVASSSSSLPGPATPASSSSAPQYGTGPAFQRHPPHALRQQIALAHEARRRATQSAEESMAAIIEGGSKYDRREKYRVYAAYSRLRRDDGSGHIHSTVSGMDPTDTSAKDVYRRAGADILGPPARQVTWLANQKEIHPTHYRSVPGFTVADLHHAEARAVILGANTLGVNKPFCSPGANSYQDCAGLIERTAHKKRGRIVAADDSGATTVFRGRGRPVRVPDDLRSIDPEDAARHYTTRISGRRPTRMHHPADLCGYFSDLAESDDEPDEFDQQPEARRAWLAARQAGAVPAQADPGGAASSAAAAAPDDDFGWSLDAEDLESIRTMEEQGAMVHRTDPEGDTEMEGPEEERRRR